MSLYNMICGKNPLDQILHAILKTAGPLPEIPRYRDTWTMLFDGEPRIVIHTRTGGGNRDDYALTNRAMTQHPMYLRDDDDHFDSTFADFYYRVPEAWRDRLLRLHELVSDTDKCTSPRVKFDRAMARIESKQSDTPTMTEQARTELETLVQDMIEELFPEGAKT